MFISHTDVFAARVGVWAFSGSIHVCVCMSAL